MHATCTWKFNLARQYMTYPLKDPLLPAPPSLIDPLLLVSLDPYCPASLLLRPPKSVSKSQRMRCKNAWKSISRLPLPTTSSCLSSKSLLSVVNLTPIRRMRCLTISRESAPSFFVPSSSSLSDSSESLPSFSQYVNTSRNSFTSGMVKRSSVASLVMALSSAVSCCLRIIRASCTNSHALISVEPSSVVSSTPASRASLRARSKRPKISSASSLSLGTQPKAVNTPCSSLQSNDPPPSVSKRLKSSRM
mmetsp:Transcript_106505/g.188584  ORF Transcript_106505/g.188584 Transcript_106505/m.188584 type:complete len:249 (-) Transcript_106505:2403-3149(-)